MGSWMYHMTVRSSTQACDSLSIEGATFMDSRLCVMLVSAARPCVFGGTCNTMNAFIE